MPPRREYGIVYNGVVLPDTDRVVRFPDAGWYDPKDDDVTPRPKLKKSPEAILEILTFHWTAGHLKFGPEGALDVYRAMQARRKENGEEMSVSVSFVITTSGDIVQLADLNLSCFHAHREFNSRGVGVEWTSPGTQKQATKLGILEGSGLKEVTFEKRKYLNGSSVQAVVPPQVVLDAAVWLANTLARVAGLPKVTNTLRTQFAPRQMGSVRGVVEHFQAANTEKVDCAGFFVDALAKAGWDQA